MQFRCHICDNLYESHHTNYKHSQGFHPTDNPTQSALVALEKTHCSSCIAMRTHDPVAARKRDLVSASGMDTGLVAEYQRKIDELSAKVQAQENQKSVLAGLQETISNLEKKLTPAPATT